MTNLFETVKGLGQEKDIFLKDDYSNLSEYISALDTFLCDMEKISEKAVYKRSIEK